MNNKIIGLVLTLIVGLSFLIGYFLMKFFNKKDKLLNITMGIAATVLMGIILFDLLPEAYELLEVFNNRLIVILIGGLVGFIFLFILDKTIPHHDDHNNSDDHNHLFHIGLITTISLILHNFIEGSAIYSVTLTDIKSGLLMMLGVSLHNIPLGMITVSSIIKKNGKFKYLFLILLILSSFLGGLSLFIIGSDISNYILGYLISITLGMTIYIVFFELIKEIFEDKNKKDSLIGVGIGILLIILSLLF